MKVAQLVMARQFRGAEVFAAQLSQHLANKSGVDISYISLYESNGPQLKVDLADVRDLKVQRGGLINFGMIRTLGKELAKLKPDIVQANAGDTLKYAVLVKVFYRLKFKIIFRNASTITQYIQTGFQKKIYRFLFRHVDFVCSVSETSKADLLIMFPEFKTKIAVIPNGVELRQFNTAGIFDKGTNLVHVGGFTFEKNHHGLIRIFTKIKIRNPGSKLYLIGDGPLRKEIEKLVTTLDLSDDVIFTGSRANVLDYIGAADALLLPSKIEGLPGVILEAMYCKTPVVAFNVGGIAEVVKNGETGWLVESGNEDQFVAAVMSVLESHDNTAVLETAHELVVSKYNNKKISHHFLAIYNQLLNR